MTTLLGCSSGQVISDVDQPLPAIQNVVKSRLPLGVRDVSANEREFVSVYFRFEGGKIRPYDGSKVRYYAAVTILGERRPYQLEVTVRRETDRGYGFRDDGVDERLATRIVTDIRRILANRPKDRDVIDEFRPF